MPVYTVVTTSIPHDQVNVNSGGEIEIVVSFIFMGSQIND